jgi:hypothetical protein
VKTFHHSIGLRVKRGGGDVGKVQKGTNLGPNGGCELRTTVRSDGVWNTKTRNPRGTESFCTCRGCGGGKRNSLWPSCGSVDHGEDVGFSLRGREGTHNVDVDVGKTAGRNGNGNSWRGNMDVDFGFLTKHTLSSPKSDVFGHCLPQKARGNKTTCGFDARMAKSVNVGKIFHTCKVFSHLFGGKF